LVAVVGVAAGLAVPTTVLASTNLIRDGGFEKPVVGAGSFQGFSTGQSFSHWTVVGATGNVAIVSGTFTQSGFSFPAKSGHQWLDLTGVSNSATGVAQTVSTSPGSSHTLSFAVGNVDNPTGIFGVTSTVKVFVNGTLVATDTNSRGAGSTSMVWQVFHVSFSAPSASTTIELINGDPANDTLNGLDAVKLT
jgi:Protein of unknown function (DUF642)